MFQINTVYHLENAFLAPLCHLEFYDTIMFNFYDIVDYLPCVTNSLYCVRLCIFDIFIMLTLTL